MADENSMEVVMSVVMWVCALMGVLWTFCGADSAFRARDSGEAATKVVFVVVANSGGF